MRAWTGRIALMMVFGVVVALVAILPAASGIAEPARPFHQTVPFVAADSATGSTSGSPNSAAGKLVGDLTTAASDEARTTVINSVFDALHIGVYGADGTTIVSGAEKSSQDYYFYDAETATMAASFGRADRWSFDDLATLFNQTKVLNMPITAVQLQMAVSNTIQQAQGHTAEAAWLSPLLVQELGLKHLPADDLTASFATSAPVLDALQRTLIVSDLLIALPHANTQVAASSNLAEASNGILKQAPVTAQAACGDFHGTEAIRNIGKFAAGFIDIAGKAIQAVAFPLDALHGSVLAFSIKVEALADNLKTHYGHETAGTPLEFPVRVSMLDNLPKKLIDCGWMAGLTFPKKGPIPLIKMDWDTGALESHGTTTCGVSCQITNDDGIATLKFQPKQEQAPYTGPLTSETGRVEASAQFLTSLGNMFGGVNEAVTPKSADFVWNVEWHSQGAWEGQMTMTWDDQNRSSQGTTDVRFEVALPAPGEGDIHTNVYTITKAIMNYSDSQHGCAT
ncbi:MAG: hypothetical protein ABI305_11545, partial [Tepidiformaceae bacterium]